MFRTAVVGYACKTLTRYGFVVKISLLQTRLPLASCVRLLVVEPLTKGSDA